MPTTKVIKTYKRRYRHKRKLKRYKSLIPKVYYFTRSTVQLVNLNIIDVETPQFFYNYSNHDGHAAAVAQMRFKLSDVPDWTDFNSLFSMYKINAVSMKMYPSCGVGGGSTRDNSQCMVYTMPAPRLF